MSSKERTVVYFDPLAAGIEPSPKMRPYVPAYDYDGLALRLESFRDIQNRELLLMKDVERLRAAAQTFVYALMPLKREVIEDCGFQGEWNALCDALASSGHETFSPQKVAGR